MSVAIPLVPQSDIARHSPPSYTSLSTLSSKAKSAPSAFLLATHNLRHCLVRCTLIYPIKVTSVLLYPSAAVLHCAEKLTYTDEVLERSDANVIAEGVRNARRGCYVDLRKGGGVTDGDKKKEEKDVAGKYDHSGSWIRYLISAVVSLPVDVGRPSNKHIGVEHWKVVVNESKIVTVAAFC
jgi:hypothetical protein